MLRRNPEETVLGEDLSFSGTNHGNIGNVFLNEESPLRLVPTEAVPEASVRDRVRPFVCLAAR